MKTLRRALLPLAIFPLKNIAYAQKRDSIPLKVRAFIADKFPQNRDLYIDFSQTAPFQFSSKLDGKDLPENKMKSFQQLKAGTNIYFVKKRNWLLSTSLNYRFTSFNTQEPITAEANQKNNFHYHSEAVNFNYFSKLFNKTAIYTATASVDGSDQHFERIRGMVTASVVLKATPKVKMVVGLAGLIDPSSQVPILPIFTYENKFNNGWVLDILLPKKLLVRKDIFANGRISLGTEMDNTSFYLYKNNRTYEFRQLEINSGAIYEHHLGGNFIGALKTGIRAVPRARVFDKEESFKDYIFEASYKPSFYFNVGVSYNPFGKPRAK
ncbi:DUF6268 family outer membrane beta-barrel protein [Chryseobacterium vrystaatense]|uniref:Outer membrane protein beta-barrel domain-containing protein n=1 Tax=Chryseobacterium vrystaatense TaxID=307480 RepID=A0ABR4UJJ2_9FLAO|nr:DUF6268 family outer membrane beta-barrel protein [Chryseobacterium vrystaatense]KFF24898.1 hypothetical protein IW16_18410 [Chryseobacterium vrystaatense]